MISIAIAFFGLTSLYWIGVCANARDDVGTLIPG